MPDGSRHWPLFGFRQFRELAPIQQFQLVQYAPERIDYGIDRYCGETVKLYGLMDRVLGLRDFLAGADYSIADMATYPWCAPIVRDLHAIDIADFPNVKRWAAAIEQRPAVQRGMALMGNVMKIGDPDDATRLALFGKR